MFNIAGLYHILQQLKIPRSLVVAYSGGLDSHALLYALAQLRDFEAGLSLRAIHINHGLSPNAAQWSRHCLHICEQLGVNCSVEKIVIKEQGGSLEELARNYRYSVLSQLLNKDECLVTAHTRDDQAETVLLQLLRGAGVKGLAAMPVKKAFGKAVLARPLLHVSRASLLAFAQQKALTWIEDESNQSLNFDRNFIRQQILTVLNARWPGTAKVLSRTAEHCAESNDLLQELAIIDAQLVCKEKLVSLEALQQLNPARQRNVLRYWLNTCNLRAPNTAKLRQLQHDFLHAKIDAVPFIQWEGAQVRRFKGYLYAMEPLLPHDPKLSIAWDMQEALILPAGLGVLHPQKLLDQGLNMVDTKKLSVGFRRGGERFQPSGRQGSHPLKKLFQEWGIPPWQRDRIPLIYNGEIMVAVVVSLDGLIHVQQQVQ